MYDLIRNLSPPQQRQLLRLIDDRIDLEEVSDAELAADLRTALRDLLQVPAEGDLREYLRRRLVAVARKDFQLGAVTNTSEPVETSVVMYTRGHKGEAKKVAKHLAISDLQLMSQEIETAAEGANVAVIVGEDNATEAG